MKQLIGILKEPSDMSAVEKVAGTSKSVAYFSMEFCVDPKLPIYSGGLGVLAGDHLKAARDLDLPVVGVGIFYHHGYFRQRFREDGWQVEEYPLVDPATGRLKTLLDKEGSPITITVPIEDREVKTQAYEVDNLPLVLLTTNVEGNSEEDRMITAHLYGGVDGNDKQTRVRQEIVLGIGGKRMLDALGVSVGVYHMNEGHSAFLPIERARELMEQDLSEEQAWERVRANQLFTSHTPVPAGNDIFPEAILEREFGSHLKVFGEGFPSLKNRANHLENHPPGSWSQAKFAMSTSAETTAVSRIHSETAKIEWGSNKDVAYVTNGVHHSWMDDEIKSLIDRDLERFIKRHIDPDYMRGRMEQIDPQELRDLRNKKRREAINFANTYLEKPLLDPNILLIGYARRAATYKRLNLPFRDRDRLDSILTNSECPIQIVLAAKAHPQDIPGKEMIQRLVNWTKDTKFRNHTLFIPDYDSRIAKYLVVGSDAWLNVPEKGKEASGTSGMKSGMNGGRQLSVDDGWMNEVPEEVYLKIEDDLNPAVVAERIYQLMQGRVVQEFYTSNGKPLADPWMAEVMRSMAYIMLNFSAARMTGEYNTKFYQPLMDRILIAA